MLVVGQAAQDRACAQERYAVPGQKQRTEHLAILKPRPIEKRDDEIRIGLALNSVKALRGCYIEPNSVEHREQFMMIGGMVAIDRIGRRSEERRVGKDGGIKGR